jgi:hypothetical protein
MVAIKHRVPLHHNDRDFDLIEKHAGLRFVRQFINSRKQAT